MKTRYRKGPIKVRADRLRDDLIVNLIPGARPYLWIGRRDANGVEHYLGSVTVRAVVGAVERSKTK